MNDETNGDLKRTKGIPSWNKKEPSMLLFATASSQGRPQTSSALSALTGGD